MCFKNLPIDFDQSGKATLKAGVPDPYAVSVAKPKGYVRRHEGPGAQLAAPPRLRDWNIDPMTRVAGALAIHTVLDLENRVAVEAHSRAMLFNYQITTPSTLNASPRDPFGGLSPYEQAIIDTPLLESVSDEQVKGIDVLRSVRSFDPCMPCTTTWTPVGGSSPER